MRPHAVGRALALAAVLWLLWAHTLSVWVPGHGRLLQYIEMRGMARVLLPSEAESDLEAEQQSNSITGALKVRPPPSTGCVDDAPMLAGDGGSGGGARCLSRPT